MLSKRILTLVSLLLISSLLVGCFLAPSIVSVTSVTLDQETLALVAGGATGTLVETVEPADATDPRVIWASSDEAVAIVALGVVTPLTAGTADITVTTVDGGFTATCEVTVSAAPVAVTGVTLDQETLALTVGDAAVTLVATVAPATATDISVIWASSDEMVAIVATGVVTPLNAGISAITATTVDGGFVATCVVTVTAVEPEPEPELVLVGIVVDPDTMDLYVGEEEDITSVTATYVIRGYDVDIALGDCLFLTSDSEVATVEVSGNTVTVTAEGVGTTNILVSYEDKLDILKVTVVAYTPMEIIADDLLTFTAGESGVFTASLVANSDEGKMVLAYLTLPVGTQFWYYEVGLVIWGAFVGPGWFDLSGTVPDVVFGPQPEGFLLEDITIDFRAEFPTAGTYQIPVEIWEVTELGEKVERLGSKVITAVVIP